MGRTKKSEPPDKADVQQEEEPQLSDPIIVAKKRRARSSVTRLRERYDEEESEYHAWTLEQQTTSILSSSSSKSKASAPTRTVGVCNLCERPFTITNGHTCNLRTQCRKETAARKTSIAREASLGDDDAGDGSSEEIEKGTSDLVAFQSTTCIKESLSHTLVADHKPFGLKWIRDKVTATHRIKYEGACVMQGFIVNSLQEVSLSTVEPILSTLDSSSCPLEVDQNVIKQALSMSSSTSGLKHTSPVRTYYETVFSPGLDNLSKHHGSALHLSGTSLQYDAQQMLTNFRTMMARLVFPKTKYWIRQEVSLLLSSGHLDELPDVQSLLRRPAVLKQVRSWISRHLIHLNKTPWFHATGREEWKQSFAVDIRKAFKSTTITTSSLPVKRSHQAAFKSCDDALIHELWELLFGRFIGVVARVFLPFEWLCTQKKDEAETETMLSNDASEDCKSVRRCCWLFAVLRRLEEIQKLLPPRTKPSRWVATKKLSRTYRLRKAVAGRVSALDSAAATATATAVTVTTPFEPEPVRLKMYHLFPMPGFIPGAMQFTDKLLNHMVKDYEVHVRGKKRKRPTVASLVTFSQATQESKKKRVSGQENPVAVYVNDSMTDEEEQKECLPLTWQAFFDKPVSYWRKMGKHASVPESLCTKFMSDGVSISFQHEKMKWRPAYQPLTAKDKAVYVAAKKKAEGGADGKAHGRIALKDKLESYRLDSLPHGDEVAGVLTIDTNRKNFFVATYRTVEDLLFSCPSSSSASSAVEFTGGKIKDVVLRISQKEYKHMRRVKYSAHVRANVIDAICARHKRESRPNMDQEPPSLKGTSPNLMRIYMQWMNEQLLPSKNSSNNSIAILPPSHQAAGHSRLSYILAMYSPLTFRRLRLESYAAEQRMWHMILDKIYTRLRVIHPHLVRPPPPCVKKRPESPPLVIPVVPVASSTIPIAAPSNLIKKNRILFALGDGSFAHNSAGHMALPSGHRLFEELRKCNELVYWVDEFNTSKCCSDCYEPMEQLVRAPFPDQLRTRKSSSETRIPFTSVSTAVSPSPLSSLDSDVHTMRTSTRSMKRAQWGTTSEKRLSNGRNLRRVFTPVLPLAPPPNVSKKCTSCTPLTPPRPLPSADTASVEVWGLRVCMSSTCGTRIWCRDVNACRNMLTRVGYLLRRSEGDVSKGPSFLCRRSMIPTSTTSSVSSSVPSSSEDDASVDTSCPMEVDSRQERERPLNN